MGILHPSENNISRTVDISFKSIKEELLWQLVRKMHLLAYTVLATIVDNVLTLYRSDD